MAEAQAQGIPLVYRPIDLSVHGLQPERLAEILDWAEIFGFDALNITHPCKRDVVSLLDVVDPVAASLGAVNTVIFTERGRAGHNTDTTGFEEALRAGLPDVQKKRVVQVGAGGAGAAVADALLRSGVNELTIVDIDQRRAHEVAASSQGRHPGVVTSAGIERLQELLDGCDGIVHCTPIGMHDHPGVPFSPDLLRSDHWVADIVYRPLETELLRAARSKGCRTLHGGLMAVAQAANAFRLVTGRPADLARMQSHFEQLITDDENAQKG